MLRVEQLDKQYNKTIALSGVSLSLAPGEIYALIGPNGSGKTTLTKIIAGLVRPTGGAVHIADTNILTDPVTAKSHIGYIPDNPEAWGKMTGAEFLHFSGALHGFDTAAREKRIAELLPVFSLNGIEDTYYEHYSRGNRQKFTILAALLHEPDLLLIDEPIVGLDPESVATLEGLLTDFAARGGTVLITTHTLLVAEHIANRVGILSQGQLIASDTIPTLRETAQVAPDASLVTVYHALVQNKRGVNSEADEL